MKRPFALEYTRVYVEFRPASFHARTAEAGIDLPVDREADGRLTPASVGRITAALPELLGGKPWLSRVKAVAGIGSRGLILRPISLPATSSAQVPRLIQLQIESEFPLPPGALAWGWIPQTAAVNPASGRQEVLVAAVRKEVVEDCAAALRSLGPDLVFTSAALARLNLVPASDSGLALLDLGTTHSELTLREPGAAAVVRLLPWGENRLVDSVAARAGQSREAAAEFLAALKADRPTPANAAQEEALTEAARQLVALLPSTALQSPLWLTGPPGLPSLVARLLRGFWKNGEPPRMLDLPSGPGRTAATCGIAQSLASRNGAPPALLALRVQAAEIPDRMVPRLPGRPLALAAALLLAVLAFPYLEALLLKPHLARNLATLKSGEAQLATIDRELSFLRYLEQNQAPHLDAIFVIAQAAPAGAHVDSLTINRQGEVAITGFLRDLSQVGDFRLKLINSGFFSTVVVEDQSPTPDRQRINFRINARWKDAADREALSLGPVLPPPGVVKRGATNPAAGPSVRPPLPASAASPSPP